MIATTLVVVVAPDKDFRRSLEFALEAEGFAVDAHASISNAFASLRARQAGCVVVDDAAIEDWGLVEGQFRRLARPVILLASKAPPLVDQAFTATLTKPFLGTPLIDAVREVTSAGL